MLPLPAALRAQGFCHLDHMARLGKSVPVKARFHLRALIWVIQL